MLTPWNVGNILLSDFAGCNSLFNHCLMQSNHFAIIVIFFVIFVVTTSCLLNLTLPHGRRRRRRRYQALPTDAEQRQQYFSSIHLPHMSTEMLSQSAPFLCNHPGPVLSVVTRPADSAICEIRTSSRISLLSKAHLALGSTCDASFARELTALNTDTTTAVNTSRRQGGPQADNLSWSLLFCCLS